MTGGGPGLFEMVTGHFANGAAVDEFDAQTQTFLSVQDNIHRILNSRRDGLVHLPDYGPRGSIGDLSTFAGVGAQTPPRDRGDAAQI